MKGVESSNGNSQELCDSLITQFVFIYLTPPAHPPPARDQQHLLLVLGDSDFEYD